MFTVYGPLLTGCSLVFYEGNLVKPDAGVIWRVCNDHKVTSLYINASDVRRIKKSDYDGVFMKKYDTSSLKVISTTGERLDADSVEWIHRHLPNVIINDTYVLTETGLPIAGNFLNATDFKTVFSTLPGSVTRPLPGYEVKIFNDSNTEVRPG